MIVRDSIQGFLLGCRIRICSDRRSDLRPLYMEALPFLLVGRGKLFSLLFIYMRITVAILCLYNKHQITL